MLLKFIEDLDACFIFLLLSQETVLANAKGSLGEKFK
jgi:hypothetical protein